MVCPGRDSALPCGGSCCRHGRRVGCLVVAEHPRVRRRAGLSRRRSTRRGAAVSAAAAGALGVIGAALAGGAIASHLGRPSEVAMWAIAGTASGAAICRRDGRAQAKYPEALGAGSLGRGDHCVAVRDCRHRGTRAGRPLVHSAGARLDAGGRARQPVADADRRARGSRLGPVASRVERRCAVAHGGRPQRRRAWLGSVCVHAAGRPQRPPLQGRPLAASSPPSSLTSRPSSSALWPRSTPRVRGPRSGWVASH